MVNFPNSLDDGDSLFITINNLRTTLSAPIDDSTLTIPVVTTSGFPDVGYITILTGQDITQAEAIYYTSITPTEFNADQRGADGTPALPHPAGNNVDHTIVAAHHSALRDAIIELEHFVGVSGSENFVRVGDTISLAASGTIFSAGEVEFTALDGIDLHTDTDTITWSGSSVKRAGDQMSGDLEMNQSRVRHAGVAEVQATGPTPAEGMVWFNTASGTGYVQANSEWFPIHKYPYHDTISFTTLSVGEEGGTRQIHQAFGNRALITRLSVIPANSSANSTVIDFYGRASFSPDELEYKATASGEFIDNATWYHNDKDGTSELHLILTNNSLVPTTYDISLDAEVFA